MINLFNAKETADTIARINQLSPATERLWGTMTPAQMLAHCNVAYELTYDNKHPKPGFFKKLLFKLFVKSAVVSEKPYPKNSRTAPEFVMTGEKNFEIEKKRLIDYINKTLELGEDHFHNKENHSFGPLTKAEWNNLFAKHLDHHLSQFGV